MAKYRCARRTATQRGLLRSSRDLHIYKTTFRDLQIWALQYLVYVRVGSAKLREILVTVSYELFTNMSRYLPICLGELFTNMSLNFALPTRT